MRNYFFILLLLCTVKIIAQENTITQAVCYQPRIDATNFNHSNMVINYGRYYATGDITSTNTILNSEYSDDSLTYFADNSIVLGDGFRATSEVDGGIKLAIENCSVCKCVTDFTVDDNHNRRDRTFEIVYNPTSCETENITFDWYFSDGMVVMNGGDVVKREYDWPIANTSARVVATMPSGCQSEISSVETGGIKPAPITIYPNPSSSIFNVNGGFLVGTTATIIDHFNGQILFEKTATIDNEIQIDLTNYPAGIYILRIYDSNVDYLFTEQIIKE